MHIKLLSVVKLTQDRETSDAKGFIDISGREKYDCVKDIVVTRLYFSEIWIMQLTKLNVIVQTHGV